MGILKLNRPYSDITQRRQAEAAERAAVAAAAAAVRQRQEFVAMVTHELRAPLGAISQSLSLIDDARLPECSLGFVTTARGQAALLRDLTADILDMSRLEAGRVVLRETDFSMPALLADISGALRDQAEARAMSIVTVVEPEVPVAQFGDAGRIRQVLTNFLSNALKYASPGVVTLRAGMAGGMLRLTVADPGPAIPPGQASGLFQPFARLRSAELGAETGTGLGLAISARLASLLGGEIGLAREGDGNAFWFTVPIAPPRGEAAINAAKLSGRSPPRGTILLVEDLAPTRDLTAIMLRREGHRVEVAADGLTAVALAARRIYDVILMDINLPDLDGITAARRIRALPGPEGRAAIVGLTGMLAPDLASEAASVMDAILSKPVCPEELAATLNRFMECGHMDAGTGVTVASEVARLDSERIATLRDGLPPGMFARLLKQCIVEIKERLPGLVAPDADAEALRNAAHALAGMAGSYGLAEFEREMRSVIIAVEAGMMAEAAGIAASAGAILALAEDAVLAET